jgi:hypothetical protein
MTRHEQEAFIIINLSAMDMKISTPLSRVRAENKLQRFIFHN